MKTIFPKIKYKHPSKKFLNEYVAKEMVVLQHFANQHGWKDFKKEIPEEGDGISVIVLDDRHPTNCVPTIKAMNSTWANTHWKEEKWTHWMYLPPTPCQLQEQIEFLLTGKKFYIS